MSTTSPSALLTREVHVRLADQPEVVPVGEISHQGNQWLAALPQAAPHPAQNTRYGVEAPAAGDHLCNDGVHRQMLIPGHRKGQRVIFPVSRELIEEDAVLRFHLVPQARARQGCQKQHVEIVHSIPTGRLGDTSADARFVYVQTDDKGTHDQDVVLLDAPDGGAEVAAS